MAQKGRRQSWQLLCLLYPPILRENSLQSPTCKAIQGPCCIDDELTFFANLAQRWSSHSHSSSAASTANLAPGVCRVLLLVLLLLLLLLLLHSSITASAMSRTTSAASNSTQTSNARSSNLQCDCHIHVFHVDLSHRKATGCTVMLECIGVLQATDAT